MIIETQNGLKILKGINGYEALFIDSSRIDDCIRYLHENNLKKISINPFQGYHANDLNFLSRLEHYIEGITVLDDKYDYAIINSLHKLKSLGIIDNKRDSIDLSNFPELESLSCDYSKRMVSLESCEQLRSLTLSGYKSGDKTIEKIPRLSSLVTLNLLITNVTSLAGIGNFPILRELTLFRASRLEDISDLTNVKNTLIKLEFDVCKKISSYDTLGKLVKLQKLIIGSSALIESLSFVRLLPELEFISFVDTNVVDGDLTPAIGIGYVGFDNKRHYNLKFSDFNKGRVAGNRSHDTHRQGQKTT
ncbi:MAG: hypothetical protein ACKVRN_06405 [Pyrinomonadaceae bacterium]